MRRILFALPILASVAIASADERHDRTLALSAARIVVERVGELRGGFAAGGDIVLVAPVARAEPSAPRTPAVGPRPGEWVDGLAIAVERPSTVSPEL
jgi:hypothetical protein